MSFKTGSTTVCVHVKSFFLQQSYFNRPVEVNHNTEIPLFLTEIHKSFKLL